MKIKEAELYQELSLYDDDGTLIGEAEVELKSCMLAKLVIYPPYQDKGYGTQVVKQICDKYGCDNLWVKADNERAIRVYQKCGFKVGKATMLEMRKEKKA